VVLLLDTYDTEAAAEKVVALARQGVPVSGVRLDSGDLAAHARRVRRILDGAGLAAVTIFASGNLDEHALHELVGGGAPIDGFGLGARVTTSADAPFLDSAYKLVEYAGRPRRKRSEGKATWPGRKQVWRRSGADGGMREDVVGLEDDAPEGTPLLVPVMRAGRRVAPAPLLAASRAHAAAELTRLPEPLRHLAPDAAYPVTIAAPLRALAATLDSR
jgi:nicotinate phosphoribosyltransferase